MSIQACKACGYEGWVFVQKKDGDAPRLERCDLCERYENDIDATLGALKVALALLVERIEEEHAEVDAADATKLLEALGLYNYTGKIEWQHYLADRRVQ